MGLHLKDISGDLNQKGKNTCFLVYNFIYLRIFVNRIIKNNERDI